jgi:uncharacterized membrane protein YhaH (DUF805 family)
MLGVAANWSDIVLIILVALFFVIILGQLLFLWPEAALVVKRLKDINSEPMLVIPYLLLGSIKLIFWIILAIMEGRKPTKNDIIKRKRSYIEDIEPEKKNWIWVLFKFNGRLRRRRYIFGSIFILGLIPISYILTTQLVIFFHHWLAYLIFIPLMIIFQLFLIWPDVSMNVKRLRDMGKEPALAIFPLVLLFIPYIGVLFSAMIRIWLMISKGKTNEELEDMESIPPMETLRLILISIILGSFGLFFSIIGVFELTEGLDNWPTGSLFILVSTMILIGIVLYIRNTISNLRQGFPRQDEYSKMIIRKSAVRSVVVFIFLNTIGALFIDLANIHLSELMIAQVIVLGIIFGLNYLFSYYLGDDEGGD